MVADYPASECDPHHPGSAILDNTSAPQLPSSLNMERAADDMSSFHSPNIDESLHAYSEELAEAKSHYVSLSETLNNYTSVVCDTNGNFDSENEKSCVETFQAEDEKSDSASTYSDPYSNSEYTDTVDSANSSTFLLPPKDTCDDIPKDSVRSDETATEVQMSYENKQCTPHSLGLEPLMSKAESIWSFAKDFEISAPVIGHIEHPGFISSQRDIRTNSNLNLACQKALRYLQDERVASSLLLPGSYKDVSKLPEKDPEETDEVDHNIVPSGRHTRNLIAISICNCMVYIACGSLRNLQSSINHEGGVGLTSLAVSNVGFVLGSVFSPFLVQNFDPYRCLIASLFPHLMFIAANFYPTMWLMLPVSLFQGVSGAVLWNAISTYITFLAKGFSEKKKETYENVLNRFFGIFCLIYQLYMIFGNLIASLVLTYANPASKDVANVSLFNESGSNFTMESGSEYITMMNNSTSADELNVTSSNVSLCGAKYCHHYSISNSGTTVSDFAKYLLFGIYIALMIVSLLIAVFLVERLNRRLFSSAVMTVGMVKTHLCSLGKFSLNKNFLLLCPLLLFSAIEIGFATAEITKAFVSCPIGVHMVGYTMICLGVSASISAYLSGWLSRIVGRTFLIATAVVLNLGLLTFMAIWHPDKDSLIILFVLIGLWGFADGIWMAQTNSLMGILFPEKFEEAFTGLRIIQGLGSAIAFAYAQSFCMASKIYIMAAVCVVGMVGYLVSEHLLRKAQHAKTVCAVKEEV